MSHLSEAFKQLLECRPGLTQAELASQAGVSAPQMSRYFSGDNQPSPEALARLCDRLPEENRAAIAAAYLRDLLPESAQDLVRIVSEKPGEVDPADFLKDVPLSRELREDLIYLARSAIRYSAVADSVSATVRILRGERESYGSALVPRRAGRILAVIITDAAGRTVEINAAFTAMCGYTIEELRGRKPGHILQGRDTESDRVQEMRDAIRDQRPCDVTLTNYDSFAQRYLVRIQMVPIFRAGVLVQFRAVEEKLG